VSPDLVGPIDGRCSGQDKKTTERGLWSSLEGRYVVADDDQGAA
jgi:hypothetical protein